MSNHILWLNSKNQELWSHLEGGITDNLGPKLDFLGEGAWILSVSISESESSAVRIGSITTSEK